MLARQLVDEVNNHFTFGTGSALNDISNDGLNLSAIRIIAAVCNG
jgi:hypothetical protein